jgi:hypothetical protein
LDVDEKKTFISINENFDDSENEITNKIIVNDNTLKFNDVFLLNINSSILSISFFLRIKSYEKTIHRKIKMIINININDNDFQFMLDTEKKTNTNHFKTKEIMHLRIDFIKAKITKKTLIDFFKIHD